MLQPGDPWTNIFYTPAVTGRETGSIIDDDDEPQPASVRKATPVEMLGVNEADDMVRIRALKWNYDRELYEDRYRRIKTISLEGFGFTCPDTPDDVTELVVNLPKGFVHSPDFGLGLAKEYRVIIETIEELNDIEGLIISRVRQTTVAANTYILSFGAYDAVRKAINNTHANALSIAKKEKKILAYNSLVHQLDPKKYSVCV